MTNAHGMTAATATWLAKLPAETAVRMGRSPVGAHWTLWASLNYPFSVSPERIRRDARAWRTAVARLAGEHTLVVQQLERDPMWHVHLLVWFPGDGRAVPNATAERLWPFRNGKFRFAKVLPAHPGVPAYLADKDHHLRDVLVGCPRKHACRRRFGCTYRFS